MTTFRAIGKYVLDATKEEKIAALRDCLIDAAMELAALGLSIPDIDDALQEAMTNAELEWESMQDQAEV